MSQRARALTEHSQIRPSRQTARLGRQSRPIVNALLNVFRYAPQPHS